MASLAITNTLSNGATILASEHNTNNSDITTYVNNRNSGSATWDAVSVANATSVPLVVNNSSGTQDIFRAQDNGSDVFVVSDGGYVTMGSQSGCRVYRDSSTQALAGATKVQFNAETYDVKSEFDSATNYRFTATKTGYYIVTATVNITTPASAPIVLIYKNGSAFVSSAAIGTTTAVSHPITAILSLTATDYVEIFANAGASGTLVNGSDTSFLAIHKVA